MKAIERELQKIKKTEERMCRQSEKKKEVLWKAKLEERIPGKIMAGLQKAFSKAFYLIFEKGNIIIEKTYDRDSLEKDFQIRDFAIDLKGGRKEIGELKKATAGGSAISTVLTTVEGIGLGALGIGLPDIVIWVGFLLRSVYETALKYGFDYELPEEKVFILEMLETAMLTGEEWKTANALVDAYMKRDTHVVLTDEDVKIQLEKTANALAKDMLITKFIQGIPIVGMVGGAANPVYYHKIMGYVQLKYRKRYLLEKLM